MATKKQTQLTKTGFIAIAILALAVMAVLVTRGHHTGKVTTSPSPSVTATPLASVAPGQAINPSSSGAAATPQPTVATRPTSSSLAAPTGDLLSSASISLSANGSEESVCQTPIGAACSIFVVSPEGKATSFSAPSINTEGGHLIDWTAQQYTPEVGTWKIYAEDSLNGETNNSPSYSFEVTP
jgi:hypothetical protein